MCRTHRSDKSGWTELKCMLALRKSRGLQTTINYFWCTRHVCTPLPQGRALPSQLYLPLGHRGQRILALRIRFGNRAVRIRGACVAAGAVAAAENLPGPPRVLLHRPGIAPRLPQHRSSRKSMQDEQSEPGCAKVEVKVGPCRVRLKRSLGSRTAAAPSAPTAEAPARLRTAPPGEISGREVCEKKGRRGGST